MPVGRFIFQTSMASPQIGIRSPLWTVYYFVAGACPRVHWGTIHSLGCPGPVFVAPSGRHAYGRQTKLLGGNLQKSEISSSNESSLWAQNLAWGDRCLHAAASSRRELDGSMR